MASIKIEKGIPVPADAGSRGKNKYPFHKMKVGDSFCVPAGERSKYAGNAYKYGTYHGQKFCCRTEGDSSRIWRTA